MKGELKMSDNVGVTEREDDFVKLYLSHLEAFGNASMTISPIFVKILERCETADEGMIVYINKPIKEKIAQSCGVSLSRISNSITDFCKRGYLKKLQAGAYQLNPYFFGKGDWSDIKNIRATYDYSSREVSVQLVKGDNDDNDI